LWEGGTGMAVGIVTRGGLMVETAGGEIVLTAGDVHMTSN